MRSSLLRVSFETAWSIYSLSKQLTFFPVGKPLKRVQYNIMKFMGCGILRKCSQKSNHERNSTLLIVDIPNNEVFIFVRHQKTPDPKSTFFRFWAVPHDLWIKHTNRASYS